MQKTHMHLLHHLHMRIIAAILLSAFCCYSAQQTTIAVIDIASTIVEPHLLADKLISELVKSDEYVVIERASIDAILQEQGFQASGCTSEECAVEIGQLAGVEKIILGIAARVGDQYTLSVRMIDVATGAIERAVSVDRVASVEDIYHSAAPQAARDLLRKKQAWDHIGLSQKQYMQLVSAGVDSQTIAAKPWTACELSINSWLVARKAQINCGQFQQLRDAGIKPETIAKTPWVSKNQTVDEWRQQFMKKQARKSKLNTLRIILGSTAAASALVSVVTYQRAITNYDRYENAGRADAEELGDTFEKWLWAGRISAGVSGACIGVTIISIWF
jgi:hypothetical protein